MAETYACYLTYEETGNGTLFTVWATSPPAGGFAVFTPESTYCVYTCSFEIAAPHESNEKTTKESTMGENVLILLTCASTHASTLTCPGDAVSSDSSRALLNSSSSSSLSLFSFPHFPLLLQRHLPSLR